MAIQPENDASLAKKLSAAMSTPLEKLCDTMLKVIDEIVRERRTRELEIASLRSEIAELRATMARQSEYRGTMQ